MKRKTTRHRRCNAKQSRHRRTKRHRAKQTRHRRARCGGTFKHFTKSATTATASILGEIGKSYARQNIPSIVTEIGTDPSRADDFALWATGTRRKELTPRNIDVLKSYVADENTHPNILPPPYIPQQTFRQPPPRLLR